VVTSVPVRELFDDVAKRYKAKITARKLKLSVTAGAETIAGDQASLTELVAFQERHGRLTLGRDNATGLPSLELLGFGNE